MVFFVPFTTLLPLPERERGACLPQAGGEGEEITMGTDTVTLFPA